MHHIPSGSIDAVVSVSAVEHNKIAKLDGIFEEFNRVLRPCGKLVVTASASATDDWYHEPSKGWCFSEDTVRDAFQVPSDTPESFSNYESVMRAYKESKELEERMSWFYFSTWRNRMPWGIWNPQYVARAVVRTKPTTDPLSDDA